jgi:hypothetical protein
MSLKLSASKLWTPRSALLEGLDRVAELTTAALDALVEDHAPDALESIRARDPPMEGSLEERQHAMAVAHRRRVAALVESIGREETIERGRRRLFPIGERLGLEARERLGVGEDIDDLVAAASVVYRALGIAFEAIEGEDGNVVLSIGRCALSENYDEVTCMVMSAADKGMIQGLNPRASMEFRRRLTDGSPVCLADLIVDSKGGEGP